MPAKEEENKQRRERREAAREEALEMIRKNGGKVNTEIMRKCMQAIYVTPEIIFRVIGLCRKMGIQVVVAPYEADAQVAYLCRSGIASCAISEDSDLLAYGCPRVWYKLDKDGKAFEITLPFQSTDKIVNKGFLKGLSHKMFIIMCVLSGTDYDDGNHIRGMGIKIAHKLVMEFGNVRNILSSLMMNPSWTKKLPTHVSINDLALHYERVSSIFLHNIVYDITKDRLLHINEISIVSTWSPNSGNTVHSHAFVIEMSKGIRGKDSNFRKVALGYVSAKSGLQVEVVETDDSELIKDIKFEPIKNVALEKISDAVRTKDELIDVPDYVPLEIAKAEDSSTKHEIKEEDVDSKQSTQADLQMATDETSTETSSIFSIKHEGLSIGQSEGDPIVSTPKRRGRPSKTAKSTVSSRNLSVASAEEGVPSRGKNSRKRTKEDVGSFSQENKRLKSEYVSVIKKIIDKSSKDEETLGAPVADDYLGSAHKVSLFSDDENESTRSACGYSRIPKSDESKSITTMISRDENEKHTSHNVMMPNPMDESVIEDMTTTSSIEGVIEDFKTVKNVRELLNTTECLVVTRRRSRRT
ncbi:XPG I domain-containing protein [Theileria equi strain WA]|uniref:Exonuclease 1 n=1 Tax=Theileria equi strain WA TaxID=1537102 RepID=L0B145_THEEQ|nr:XPG I domain-containing protein [Theileria equi strain WA]AFZ80951.1 XPG I domain-containing protein [Theileria equi strain WA]|eukprot:XP_004830617.1 XPG I domain-containing protein [Theileria equi strain WA]